MHTIIQHRLQIWHKLLRILVSTTIQKLQNLQEQIDNVQIQSHRGPDVLIQVKSCTKSRQAR